MILSPYDDPQTAAEIALHDIQTATDRFAELAGEYPAIAGRFCEDLAEMACDLSKLAATRSAQ
jgi:hypothetical protein